MPSRRKFLAGAAVGLGAAALPIVRAGAAASGDEPTATPRRTAAARTPDRPNVVLILADDLGYGEVGAYGQQLMRTPTMDRLAAEGLTFTQAYANAPVCAPARCSLLTGMHTGHAAVRQNPFDGPQGSLGPGDTTFGEVLRAQGYRTACIGKWGFGPEKYGQPSSPAARGFDEFFGYITHAHAQQYYPTYLWDNGRKVRLTGNDGGAQTTYAPDLIQDRALRFLDGVGDDPFLLYLTPNLPHAPSAVPSLAPYEDRPWPRADRGHAAQVTRLDSYVGAVVDRLRRRGLADRTLVIVTSDNGPHEEKGVDPDRFNANGPLRGYKRNLYEGGIRVPFIAWSPGRVPPGVSTRPLAHIDILPTLAALSGAPAPKGIDGLTATPALTGHARAGHRPGHLYWYRNDKYTTPRADREEHGRMTHAAEAVRSGDWKAVRYAPGRDRTAPAREWQVELYDLAKDPSEKRDVAAKHPAVTDRLVRLMRTSWRAPQTTSR